MVLRIGEAASVTSYEDLAELIRKLELDLSENVDKWENQNLEFYLNAMGRWVGSIRQLYRNRGEELPEQPTWEFIGKMLLVARDYE